MCQTMHRHDDQPVKMRLRRVFRAEIRKKWRILDSLVIQNRFLKLSQNGHQD